MDKRGEVRVGEKLVDNNFYIYFFQHTLFFITPHKENSFQIADLRLNMYST